MSCFPLCPTMGSSILKQARDHHAKNQIELTQRVDALHQAVLKNEIAMIPCLMKNLSDLKLKGLSISYNPICHAILFRFHSLIEELIKYGADVNQRDENLDEFPLNIAIPQNDVKITQLLIAHGADNSIGEKCNSHLHLAVSQNCVEVAKYFIDNGADVNKCHFDGTTLLHYALIYHKDMRMAKLLIENGANIQATNARRETPLDLAIQFNQVEIIHMLMGTLALCHPNASALQPHLDSPIFLEVESQVNRFDQKNPLLFKILSMKSTNQLAYYSQNKKIKNLEHTIKSNGPCIVENQLKQRFREQLKKGEERYPCLNVFITTMQATFCKNTPNLPSELWGHIASLMTTSQIKRLTRLLTK